MRVPTQAKLKQKREKQIQVCPGESFVINILINHVLFIIVESNSNYHVLNSTGWFEVEKAKNTNVYVTGKVLYYVLLIMYSFG